MRGVCMVVAAASALLTAGCAAGGSGGAAHETRTLSDSAFRAMEERGAAPEAMGVDQRTSVHRFDDLPDGGRIELQRAVADPDGVAQIRMHLEHIAQSFARGDFSIPMFVHDVGEVPGTAVMRERRDLIRYEFNELPAGGEVRMYTSDPDALRAIHEFLAFQRADHRAGGGSIESHDHHHRE